MDFFLNALVSDGTSCIPKEFDWFGPLIGNWDFDYYDSYDKDEPRHVEGEWIFRRILEGAGIEDLFICPSRASRMKNPQPDGEYGVAIRMFHPKKQCYDMVYTFLGKMTRLEFRKEGDSLVGTLVDKPNEQWKFSEITASTFHWQNITRLDNGTLKINSNVYAKRKETEDIL